MARSEARLQFGIWRSLEDIPAHARLLYVVLLTERTVNHAGIGAVRIDQWERASGLTADEIEDALGALAKEPHILVDRTTGEFLIRTMIRNDGYETQPYLLKGALKDALLTESRILRRALAAELRKLPPQQPPKVGKGGRMVTYPDPHATADQLDPDGPDADREPGDNSTSKGVETLSESDISKGSREGVERLHGGGGGGGGGSCSVVGSVGGSVNDAITTADDPQPPLPVIYSVPAPRDDVPPRCRVHAKLPPDVDPGGCPGCGKARTRWEAKRAELRAAGAAKARAAIDACPLGCDDGWHHLPPHTPGGHEVAQRCSCNGGPPRALSG